MNVGIIIFIIFSIISFISSVIEKQNKDKQKNGRIKTSNGLTGIQHVQQTLGQLEKEFNEFKQHPDKKIKEIEKRFISQESAQQIQPIQDKARLKDKKEMIERGAAKKIKAFEEKVHKKEILSLAERIAKIEADPHLSPRQKMNRINMIRMEDDIDRASSLVEFTPESTLKGIIFSEILGPPKSRR
ncbi:hypothetical protein [Macrococcoides caseolyticum]|uniref:hypothetical protein n=1 Tax=Macrococcoides caseolyticum TaxID=69966 RepID=UPI001F3A5059|nr:hypothetical protein [Macrococcus caseolyticus]MCE4956151.1 hypothetical protein [Macrococcus caseolyticus]